MERRFPAASPFVTSNLVCAGRAGSQDPFILTLASDGTFKNVERIQGSAEQDWGTAIDAVTPNSVYTTGFFKGTTTFDPDGKAIALTSAGQQDSFVYAADYMASTDIALLDATTADFQKLSVRYEIANRDASPFILRAYMSSDEVFDPLIKGGTDVALGQLGISDPPQLVVNTEQTPFHPVDLSLPAVAYPTLDTRFILVVADPDKGVDESNEDNNAIFVIPLFLEKKGKSGGGFLKNGNFEWRETGRDFDFVEQVTHRVFDDSTAHALNLTDPLVTSAIWQSVGTIKNEEFKDFGPKNTSYFPAFNNDDARINRGLVAPLTELVRLITKSRNQDRLTSTIRITEAYDQNGEHQTYGKPQTNGKHKNSPQPSTHYEGRGIDFGTDEEGRKRLTGLALLAGFQRFDNELNSGGGSTLHVHVAHDGPVIPVSLESLEDNIEYGRRINVIGQNVYSQLRALLDGAIRVKGSKPLSGLSKAELKELGKWIAAIEKTAKRHSVKAPRQLIANPNEITQGMGHGTLKNKKPGGLEFNAKAFLDQVDAARKQFPLRAADFGAAASAPDVMAPTLDSDNRQLGSISAYFDAFDWEGFSITVDDLPEGDLGRAGSGLVTIDSDANGAGWFIDTTPRDHSEFTELADGSLVASPDSPAYGRYDLMTVVLHEIGHLQGHDHTEEGLMAATLPLGTRRLPDWDLHFGITEPHHDEVLPEGALDRGVVEREQQSPDFAALQRVTAMVQPSLWDDEWHGVLEPESDSTYETRRRFAVAPDATSAEGVGEFWSRSSRNRWLDLI